MKNISQIAKHICEAGDLPSSSLIINKILDLDPEEELTLEELATLILKDYGLTNKVIRLANTCYYNPYGREITTVSRAIVILGTRYIKEIALASTLFEVIMKNVPIFRKETVSQLMTHSYLSAFLSRYLPFKFTENKEEIFISTLFYKIGRILLAIHAPEVLREWEEKEKKKPEIIQKRLYRLLEYIAVCWSLPGKLLKRMEGSPKIKEDQVAYMIKELNQKVEEFLISKDPKSLEYFFSQYGVTKKDLKRYLARAGKEIKELWPPLGQRITGDLPEKTTFFKKRTKKEKRPKDFYLQALREISCALAGQELNYQQIILMVIETLSRTFKCQGVYLGILSLDKKEILIKYGVGEKKSKLKGTSFPNSHFFQLLFKKGIEWSGPVESLPEKNPWRKGYAGFDILISPLTLKGHGIGAIFSLRKRPFSQRERQKSETLRNMAVVAISRQKNS